MLVLELCLDFAQKEDRNEQTDEVLADEPVVDHPEEEVAD